MSGRGNRGGGGQRGGRGGQHSGGQHSGGRGGGGGGGGGRGGGGGGRGGGGGGRGGGGGGGQAQGGAAKPLLQGVVKSFAPDKGFGFIVPDGGGADVFVHYAEIIDPGGGLHRELEAGQRVQFHTKLDKGRTQASSVLVAGNAGNAGAGAAGGSPRGGQGGRKPRRPVNPIFAEHLGGLPPPCSAQLLRLLGPVVWQALTHCMCVPCRVLRRAPRASAWP